MPSTVRLQRVFKCPPEKVYRAWLDPDAIVKWNPPHGFTARVHELDARVGGTYRMSFTNFTTGTTHTFGGRYLELVPDQRIRVTDAFDNPDIPGEMVTTITLTETSIGTEVMIMQENLPDAIPPEACTLGWQECLDLLAKLVEPAIPDII